MLLFLFESPIITCLPISCALYRNHLFEFIIPNVGFQHDILILTNFLNVPQNDRPKHFGKFLFSSLISAYYPLLLALVLDVSFKLALLNVVDFEVFSGIVQALEEMHHVPQSDVHLHLVHAFEYFSGFDFTVDKQGNLWPVKSQFLFVIEHLLLPQGSGVLLFLTKEYFRLNFQYLHNQVGDHKSEILNFIPKSQNNSFL